MRRSRDFRGWIAGGLAALTVLLAAPASAAGDAEQEHTDLLIGVSLLEETLTAETHLEYLLWLRELTLQGPAQEVERLMTTIYEASGKRAAEMTKLRELSPSLTAEPPPSLIGAAIQAAAKWAGTKEMLFPDGEFGMRFVFLQAQATRMITVIAQQTAKIDPNPERKKWLEEVGQQYADYREELVKSVERCEPR